MTLNSVPFWNWLGTFCWIATFPAGILQHGLWIVFCLLSFIFYLLSLNYLSSVKFITIACPNGILSIHNQTLKWRKHTLILYQCLFLYLFVFAHKFLHNGSNGDEMLLLVIYYIVFTGIFYLIPANLLVFIWRLISRSSVLSSMLLRRFCWESN